MGKQTRAVPLERATSYGSDKGKWAPNIMKDQSQNKRMRTIEAIFLPGRAQQIPILRSRTRLKSSLTDAGSSEKSLKQCSPLNERVKNLKASDRSREQMA